MAKWLIIRCKDYSNLKEILLSNLGTGKCGALVDP
jgi:hypothetical protein